MTLHSSKNLGERRRIQRFTDLDVSIIEMGISNQQKKNKKIKTSTNLKRNKQGKSELSLFSYTAQRVRERERGFHEWRWYRAGHTVL